MYGIHKDLQHITRRHAGETIDTAVRACTPCLTSQGCSTAGGQFSRTLPFCNSAGRQSQGCLQTYNGTGCCVLHTDRAPRVCRVRPASTREKAYVSENLTADALTGA